MIVINSSTRQFNIPGADLVFGVTADSGSEIKHFQCPRYVGNNIDLAGSFIRINYRNANNEMDFHKIDVVTVDGDNVLFDWELHPKVTKYRGNVSFVVCVVGPDLKVKWHTTLGRGQVLEGLEPDDEPVLEETEDAVAQLVAMVEAQTAAVEAEGGKQIKAVQDAAKAAETASVAQIEAKGASTLATIPEVYTAVQSAVRSAANAIRGKVYGEVIRVDDVSPMGHHPVVRVSGKNRCPVNELTVSGEHPWANKFIDATIVLPKGTYTVSADYVQSGTQTTVCMSVRDAANTGEQIVAKSLGEMAGKLTATFEITESSRTITIVFYSNLTTNILSTSCTFANIQLEKGSTATDYTPYIDPTTVTVTRCGKNLIPYPYTNSYATLHGLTYSDGDNGVVKVVGTTTQGTNFFFAMHQRIKAGTYTLSGMANLSGMIALIYDDATKTTLAKLNGGADSVTFTIDADAVDCNIYLNQAYANKEVSGYVQLQLELANTATNYEPYNGETQIPAADGTVSGLSSVSPTMTLLTDKAGVNIECEYSRDTNVVIGEILEKITALGG